MAFNVARYKSMYRSFLGPLSQPITLMVNNGVGFDSFPDVSAHVTGYKEYDLVAGGSIQLGDLKLIILKESMPAAVTKLGLKDRVEIEGRTYGVVHWDGNSRSIGAEVIAVQCGVRG